MTVGEFLGTTTTAFKQVGITSARLDAQILLGDALNKDKSWLLANPESKIPKKILESVNLQAKARLRRIPLAYIRGHIEFYRRNFMINPNVLIPRPETESLIELIKKYVHLGRLIDVGTGSGIIAATAALEQPLLKIEACDISTEALRVTVHNTAMMAGSKIKVFQSDLLNQASGQYDAVVANLPYVSRSWQVSPEVSAEPAQAVFADDDGLALIYKLIAQVPKYLNPGGYLILEADPRQHDTIKKAAAEHGLNFVEAIGLGICFKN